MIVSFYERRAGCPRTADKMSALRLSSAENPAVRALHPIVWAHDVDAHVDFLCLRGKTDFVVAALKSQMQIQTHRALIVGRNSNIETQNGASLINRQRFVVSGFELANDRVRIHDWPNSEAARRVNLQRSRDRILVERAIRVDVITRGNLHHDRGLNDTSTLRSITREVTVDADVWFRRGCSLKALRENDQSHDQKKFGNWSHTLSPCSELHNASRIQFMFPLYCVDIPRPGECGNRSKIKPTRRQARLLRLLSKYHLFADDDALCVPGPATP